MDAGADSDCKITNFTSDWTDGKAVGALVNKFAPGACRDWESWEEDYAKRNIEEAMKMAEDWLQVAQVITASDMQSGKADEICVMAYLAQFCSCTETEVPIGPRKPVVNEINIGTTEMTVNWCHRPRPVIQPVQEYQVEYIEGAGRRAGRPAGHWKKHPDQIPNTIFTCTVKNLEHYQEYGFCVRGLHDGSKYGPISPLSDLAITTPNLDLSNIRYILMEATEKLCGFLDPYYVIENMYARRMLSFADKQKIKSIQAFSDKVDFLLQTLRRKEAKAYFVFMSALCKERDDLFREVVNIECEFTKAPKLHSKFSQPKALEVTKGDGPRKANVVHEPRKRPRPKGNENTVPGAAPKRTRYGNKGTASEADVPKRTQYDIKIKMDLQGGPVDHLKMIDTIFSQMLKPQILSNLVNNTFNPLGCTLVKFITIPAGSIQYSVQCADVIVLKDTFQSTEDSSLDKQLDRALLTKDVIGEEVGITIKTKIDEAEFKQAEEKLVKLDLPGIPSTPNAVNIDKTSVKLTWSPPEGNQESGKFRVTAYIVEKCDISKGYWSQVNKKVCESSYAIKNLTPGNQYQFRIRAVNAAGVGEASAPIDIITAKELPPYSLFDSPSQPGKPEGEIISRTSIRITWLAPKKDGGSPITGYVIEQSLGQSEQWTRVSKEKVTEPSYTIEDLKAGTQYQFRVYAENMGGRSDPSQPSEVIALEDSKVITPSDIGEWEKQMVIGEGKLRWSTDIAIHENGDIAIADSAAECVLVYNTQGEYRFNLDTTQKLEYPGVLFTPQPKYMAVTSHNNVIISDYSVVQIVNQHGLVHRVQCPGMSVPYGVCFHSGVLFICDRDSANIFCFTQDATHLTTIPIDAKQQRDGWGGCYGMAKSNSKLIVSRGEGSGRVEVYTRKK
ncbi:uncharacterized protein [Amphiura filiformis]|uniref:uncharacterized protein n=1 Tax=Amphiura filiformis TaxID=82378 RepID=UPI003B219C66